MAIEAGVRLVLTADSGVTGQVGTRIYPLALPQNPTYPAVRYQRISTEFLPSLDGQTTRARTRLQIDTFSPNPDDAATAAAAIVDALEGYGGTSDGTVILHCRRDNEQQEFDADINLYRVIQDWFITYSE